MATNHPNNSLSKSQKVGVVALVFAVHGAVGVGLSKMHVAPITPPKAVAPIEISIVEGQKAADEPSEIVEEAKPAAVEPAAAPTPPPPRPEPPKPKPTPEPPKPLPKPEPLPAPKAIAQESGPSDFEIQKREEEQKRKAEEETRRRAEEAARRQAEEDARRQAEEAARQAAAAEAARQAAAAEAARKAAASGSGQGERNRGNTSGNQNASGSVGGTQSLTESQLDASWRNKRQIQERLAGLQLRGGGSAVVTISVRFSIDANGRANATINSISGGDLRQADVLRILNSSRFNPPKVNGQAVSGVGNLTIRIQY